MGAETDSQLRRIKYMRVIDLRPKFKRRNFDKTDVNKKIVDRLRKDLLKNPGNSSIIHN